MGARHLLWMSCGCCAVQPSWQLPGQIPVNRARLQRPALPAAFRLVRVAIGRQVAIPVGSLTLEGGLASATCSFATRQLLLYDVGSLVAQVIWDALVRWLLQSEGPGSNEATSARDAAIYALAIMDRKGLMRSTASGSSLFRLPVLQQTLPLSTLLISSRFAKGNVNQCIHVVHLRVHMTLNM